MWPLMIGGGGSSEMCLQHTESGSVGSVVRHYGGNVNIDTNAKRNTASGASRQVPLCTQARAAALLARRCN